MSDIRIAGIVLQTRKVVFECPYCGLTLFRTTYDKLGPLLEEDGPPRGKICNHCGGTCELKLEGNNRETVRSRFGG